MAQENKRDRKKTAGHNGSVRIIAVLLIIVCALIGFRTVQISRETETYNVMAGEYEEEIREAYEEQDAIRSSLEYINSKEYIEDMAREKLGLVYDNEIIFKKQGR